MAEAEGIGREEGGGWGWQLAGPRYSVYLPYYYKSANTDGRGGAWQEPVYARGDARGFRAERSEHTPRISEHTRRIWGPQAKASRNPLPTVQITKSHAFKLHAPNYMRLSKNTNLHAFVVQITKLSAFKLHAPNGMLAIWMLPFRFDVVALFRQECVGKIGGEARCVAREGEGEGEVSAFFSFFLFFFLFL